MDKNIPQKDAEKAVKNYYSSKYNESLKPQVDVPSTNSFRRYRSKINRQGVPRKFLDSDNAVETNPLPAKKITKKPKRKTTSQKSKNKKRKSSGKKGKGKK